MSANNYITHLRFGIREKLLAPLFVGLIIIISILFLFWQPGQLLKEKDNFIVAQTNILKTLGPSIVHKLLSNDLSQLHSLLENAMVVNKNEWRYIKLVDSKNNQLYPIFSSKPKGSETILIIKLDIEEDNEIFGEIQLHTDWKKTKEEKLDEINLLSVTAIIIFIFIATISFIMQTKWIRTPITRLKDVASQIARAHYNVQLPEATNDEIGSLTTSIDDMRNNIQNILNELTNKEKMQRAILESAPDAIITLNKKGIIHSFNLSAEKVFKYDADEAIGKNIKTLIPDEFILDFDKFITNLNDTDASHVTSAKLELYGKNKNGHIFPIEITINTKIIDGELLFTGILRDITERKKIDRMKDEFISTVSHELRTPLTAIRGAIGLVLGRASDELPEKAKNMLEMANRNSEHLTLLINDILDLEKLESGKMTLNFKTVDLEQLTKQALEANHGYALEHDVRLEIKEMVSGVMVEADDHRLLQVFSNLISNAVKYSPKQGVVEVSVTRDSGQVRVSVRDYGAGISEEFQSRIFQRFSQADSSDTREKGGTGLGLSITKAIVEQHGGKVDFSSPADGGVEFYFELPEIAVVI